MSNNFGYIQLSYPQLEYNHLTEQDSNKTLEKLSTILKDYKFRKFINQKKNCNNNNNTVKSNNSNTSLKILACIIINFSILILAFYFIHKHNSSKAFKKIKTNKNQPLTTEYSTEKDDIFDQNVDWNDYYVHSSDNFLSLLDTKTNPCDDFYQFACGNWINRHSQYTRFQSFTRFKELHLKNTRYLAEKLSEPGCFYNSTHSDALCSAKKYFRVCVKDGKYYANKSCSSIKGFIDQFDSWPAKKDFKYWEWNLGRHLAKLHSFKIFPLFKLTTTDKYKNYILTFEHNTLFNNDIFNKSLLIQFGIHLANELGFEMIDEEKIIKDILDFEYYLHSIILNHTPKKLIDYHRLMSFFECGVKIEIDTYLDLILTEKNLNKTSLKYILDSEEYFRELCFLVRRTSPSVIFNYLNFFAISKLLPHAHRSFGYKFENFSQVVPNFNDKFTAKEKCAIQTDKAFSAVTGGLFIMDKFETNKVEKVFEMFNLIKKNFNNSMISWFSKIYASPDQNIKTKLRIMKINIGFNETVIKNKFIENLYRDYQMTGNNLCNYLIVKSLEFKAMLNELLHYRPSESILHITDVNAYYSISKNTIIVPAGILFDPFFELSNEDSFNYGSLGSIIGHELIHGFDLIGRYYDERGKPKELWDYRIESEFMSKARCFKDQYKEYKIDEDTNLNGNLTLNENIADVHGLKFSLKAFMSSIQYKQATQASFGFTKNQLFFIRFAQSFCAITTKEFAEATTKNDVHSYSKYRVIGALSNNEDFSQAFSCSSNTPMNPAEKCNIW